MALVNGGAIDLVLVMGISDGGGRWGRWYARERVST